MSDYVSRQYLLDEYDRQHQGPPGGARKIIAEAPAEDVVPVRHGKWTHKPDVYGVVYCSECNYELHANSTSFCSNCGARMDGGKED